MKILYTLLLLIPLSGAIGNANNFQSNVISPDEYILPVQILNWDVVMINKQMHATWKAANDAGIARYEVEKSLSGSEYSQLKAVSSMRSAGTSTYGVVDRMPVKGWNYYRLKITDDQGKITYTAIKKIFVKEEANWASNSITPDTLKAQVSTL